VFCGNRSDLLLGGHASPGGREDGVFLARVDTMTRIHRGPSAVTKERQGKARGGTSLEADVEFPTREGIDGQPSRDIEDRDGTVDKGSSLHATSRS